MKKYILVFICTFFLCLVSYMVIATIPNKYIKTNMYESAEYMYNIRPLYYFNNDKVYSSLIHNYPDPITFNLLYSLDNRNPIKSIFLTKYYTTNKFFENVNLREKVIHDYSPNIEYYRYWHGNIVLIKLLLLFFNYKQILIFLALIQLLMIILITYHLLKRDKLFAVLFLLANISVKIVVTFFCLEYSYMFLLSYFATLISFKLINEKEEKIYAFFISFGVLANFLDFLTTETLVFTLPFLVIYYFRYKNRIVDKKTLIFFFKCFFAFFISFSLMWFLKWAILIVFFGLNPLSFLTEHIIVRSFNESILSLNLFSSIYINLVQLFPFCYLPNFVNTFIIITIIILIITIFIIRKYRLKEFILILIGLVPILRYLIVFMHSYDNFFFTYRALFIIIIVIGLLLKKDRE